MKHLGLVVRGPTTLWFRGAQPSRIDAEWLTYLWQKGRKELRAGTQKYEEPFESFGDGMRKVGLEGGQPGLADWCILLQDPPAKLLGAIVAAALRLYWKTADAAPRARPVFSDREIYPDVLGA